MINDNYTSYRNIVKIAYPVMISSLAQNIIGVIDIAFMGRVGEAQLGAAGLAGIYYFIMVLIGFGFNGGLQIVVARRIGEGRPKEAGNVFDHEFYIILVVSFLQFLLMHFFSFGLLRLIIHSDDVYKYVVIFLFYRSYGIFFAVFNSFCQAFFIAIGKTKVLNFSTPILLAVNVVLDYALIFGHWGLPQWGVKGAALASASAEFSVSVFYFVFLFASGEVQKYNLLRFVKFSFDEILKLLKLSIPLVVQYSISIITWFGFFVVISNLGALPLAASNVMRGIYIFCGIPCWALGSTTNSMVSNLIGQKRQSDVIRFLEKVIALNFSIIVVICVLLFLFSTPIIGIFTNDEQIIAQTILIVPIVILALLLMSLAFNCIFAVTGTGSTLVGLMIEITAISIYIIYTYLSAYRFHLALRYIWGAEIIYWIVTFIICGLYLKSGRWKKVVV